MTYTEHLRRLPRPPLVRQKIADALRGHTVSEETRAKISQKMKGRKKSPETIERMRAARAARPKAPKTDIEIVNRRRWERLKESEPLKRLRLRQKARDLRAAYELGDLELMKDVKRSFGWWVKRKRHDLTGKVSDGVTKLWGGRVMHVPYMKALREPGTGWTRKDGPWDHRQLIAKP